ncbi:MAG TPA: hypothetical protein DEP00_06245 [Lachnospiraceae bacterium]|nr:hypothetical protein [Lachnospiraceae bacterium]
MRKRKITDAQLERAVELRQQKMSLTEISRQLGFSTSTLSYWMARMEDYGMVENLDLRNSDDETVNEILELRRKNLTYKEIAERTGKSMSNVVRICRRNGVKASGRTYRKKAGRPKKK